MTPDRYDNDILKQLTRIANALDRIAKRLPEECDTAEYAKEHPDWAEKVKKMASGEYVRVIRCKDCRCFIPLEDMKKTQNTRITHLMQQKKYILMVYV